MTDQLFDRAVSLHRAGRLEEAEGLYRQALEVKRDDPQVFYLHGVALFHLQRLPESLEATAAALALAPEAPHVLELQGALLQTLGRPAEALAVLTRAAAVAPGSFDAWYNTGVALDDLDRQAEAVAAFDRALALQSSPTAWSGRAAALRRLGRMDEALASVDKALAAAPQLATALWNRALILCDMNQLDAALQACERLCSVDPGAADAWVKRGQVLGQLGRLAEAVQSADRALERRPDHPEAWAMRAAARAGLRQFEAAAADFEAALKIAPERADIWFNSTAPLIALQRFDQALDALDQTLTLDPAHPVAQLRRGEVLFEAGRIAEGMDQIAQWAQRAYAEGAAPVPEPVRSPEAKQRHDDEQRAWLAARGVAVVRGLHIDGGDRVAGPAVNLANQEAVAGAWAASDPKMVVIDQLLTPPALEGLRRFCRGSTIWRRSYRQGYLGAFPEHGFACPLLAQIAEELREVFPTVLGVHGLLVTWGFKYDSRLGGILTHADPAAVNVNFWITPEEANLDPQSGGMVVWDAAPPPEWEFRQANSDNAAITAFLDGAGAKATTVPYRENRAVIFDSNLFHKTDRIDFREGYENRRINVTMLYGRRNPFNL